VTTEQMDALDDERREAARRTRAAEGKGFECDEDADESEGAPDAITTYGSRMPSTLAGMPPIAAYNLGWRERGVSNRAPEPISSAWEAHRLRTPPEDPSANPFEPGPEPEPELAQSEVTQAEEPIENRLRRAFLNGFKEGVDRASQTLEGWGRWDA
jgi:hypothetical protein